MTQKQKRTFLMCRTVGCGLCQIERDLAEYGVGGLCSPSLERQSVLWVNIVVLRASVSKQPWLIWFPLSRKRICLAHEFQGDIRGLVCLSETHNIKTLEDLCQRRREEIESMYGIGPYTMKELDRLMERFGQKYKESKQMELFCPETFPCTSV